MLLQVTTMALGAEEHPWQRFFRTLFWLGVIMGGATLLQYMVLLFFAHQRWTPPVMAIFPRPQLFLVLMGLPSLVQAASGAVHSLHAACRSGCWDVWDPVLLISAAALHRDGCFDSFTPGLSCFWPGISGSDSSSVSIQSAFSWK